LIENLVFGVFCPILYKLNVLKISTYVTVEAMEQVYQIIHINVLRLSFSFFALFRVDSWTLTGVFPAAF